MPRNRLPPWHEEFVLPNRRAILIRPIRPEDASPLQGVFGMLGPAELRAGFGGGDSLDDAAAAQLSRPDPKTELVLVGAEPLPPGEAMIAGLGELKKNGRDPLFAINHTCAMLRANINRLFRRTWCTSKSLQHTQDHIDIFIDYYNEKKEKQSKKK